MQRERVGKRRPEADRARVASPVERMPGSERFLAQDARSSGHPLDSAAKSRLEPLFGHNFGDVRVHADSDADALSNDFNARAFTAGNDLFFGVGEYAPDTLNGRHLLAHELTHVVQQSRFGVNDGFSLSHSTDASEADASAAADNVVAGRAPSVTATPNAGIAREEKDEEGSGFWKAMQAMGSVAAPFIPFGDTLMGTVHGGQGLGEMAEGKTGKGALGLASMANGIVSTAAELGGFELWGAEGVGMTELGALGGAELGTLGMAGPAAAVIGSGLGGAALGTYLSENTEVGENSVGAVGAIDRLLGGDPEHGKSAVVAMDDYRQQEWDRGGTGYLTGTAALLGEAGIGTAAAVGGLAEGAVDGAEWVGKKIWDLF